MSATKSVVVQFNIVSRAHDGQARPAVLKIK